MSPTETEKIAVIIFLDFFFQKAKLLRQKKDDGNAAFKSSKWQEAYDLYTEALAIDPCNKSTNAKLYFNRATVAAKVPFSPSPIIFCIP